MWLSAVGPVLGHAAAQLHAHFATSPSSSALFFFYFVNPPSWAWVGLSIAAAGGYQACLSSDAVCQQTAKLLMFGSSYEYDGIPHVELAFIVFMLLWFGTVAFLSCAVLWR